MLFNYTGDILPLLVTSMNLRCLAFSCCAQYLHFQVVPVWSTRISCSLQNTER